MVKTYQIVCDIIYGRPLYDNTSNKQQQHQQNQQQQQQQRTKSKIRFGFVRQMWRRKETSGNDNLDYNNLDNKDPIL